jgi:serine/threonine-protein kinase
MASNDAKPTDLAVGDVLHNTFRLEEKIGEGGMGRVFRAADLKLDRRVAVKGLFVSNLDTETVRRFDRETQVMGQLDHPGIVTLYSFGRTRNIPWLAMQLLEGHDLWGELAAHGGRLSPSAMLPVVRQILQALGYLHGRNVVHRDLKPSNIHISPKGKVTLCDFGLARGHKSSLTKTGIAWGTPDYMAPEQIVAERELDGRADLYALSVVLYRMIAGAPVFPEGPDHDLLRAHLSAPRPDLSRRVPGLSPLLGAALQKGLAIHAEDRFQTAAEMLASLEVVLTLPVGAGAAKAPAPRPSPKRAAATAPTKPEGKAVTRDDDEVDAPATNPAGFPALSSTLVDEDDSGSTPALGEREQPTHSLAAIADAVTGEAEAPSDASSGGSTVVVPHPKPKTRAAPEPEPSEPSAPPEPDSAGTVIKPHPRPSNRGLPVAKDFEPMRDGSSGGTVVTGQPTAPSNTASITQPQGMSVGVKAGLIAAAAVGLFLMGLAVARLFL